MVSRADGRFICVHCSASSASRVQVHAMSIRTSLDSGTRRVFRHHSAFGGSIPAYFRREHGQSRKAPLASPKENPAETGGSQRGLLLGKLGVWGICQVGLSIQDRFKRSKIFTPIFHFPRLLLLLELLNFRVQTIPMVAPRCPWPVANSSRASSAVSPSTHHSSE